MLTPKDIARRAANRRFNEGVKLFMSCLNALAVTTIGAAFLLPAVNRSLTVASLLWLLLAFGPHLTGQAALRWPRSED